MRYQKIESRIWNDERFIKLSPLQQRLFLYVLTCPHGNLIGLFVLKKGYIIEDLKVLPKDLERDLQAVLKTGMIEYDSALSLVWIKKFLKHNPLTNPNQKKAVPRILADLPKSHLIQRFVKLNESSLEGLTKDFETPFEENPKPETDSDTDTDTETDKKHTPTPPKAAIAFPNWLNQELWQSFVEYRKQLPKSKFTPTAEKLCLGDLEKLISEHGIEYQQEIIEATIKSCKWLSFYPPRRNGNGMVAPTKLDKTMELFARRERERQEQEAAEEAGNRHDPATACQILPS
jgi:hypothetical protein